MPWSPLDRFAVCICIHPYTQAPGTDDLSLQIGDELYVFEKGGRDDAWYRGYLLSFPSITAGLSSSQGQPLTRHTFTGTFPAACVEFRYYCDEEVDDTDSDQPKTPDEKYLEDKTKRLSDAFIQDGGLSPPATQQPNQDLSDDDDLAGLQDEFPSPPGQAPAPVSVEERQTYPNTRRRSYQSSRRTSRRIKPPGPVPAMKIGDDTDMGKDEPLMDEIASCLREWYAEKLHQLLLSRQYTVLGQMTKLVNRLDYSRRKLQHRVLTASELDKLRQQAIWDLARANKLLRGGVIVRSLDDKGRLLTAQDSCIEVTKLQAMMSLLDDDPNQHVETKALYQIYVNLKNFTPASDSQSWLELSLYSKRDRDSAKLLSEPFYVDAIGSRAGVPISFDGGQRTLFTDISGADIGESANEQSQLYLIVKLITSEQPYVRKPSTPNSASGRPTLASPSGTSSQDTLVGSMPRTLNSALRTGSIRGGRQSLMWGRKSRKDSETSISKSGLARVETSIAESPISENDDQPPGTPDQPVPNQKPLRRMTGFALLNISGRVRDLKDHDMRLEIQYPVAILEGSGLTSNEEKAVAKEVLTPLIEDGRQTRPSSLALHLKAYQNPRARDLVQATPTLFYNAALSQRIGFSDAPRVQRSDIYLTLRSPNIPQHAWLLHPRENHVPISAQLDLANLLVTLEVRRGNGERLENALWSASNHPVRSAWRSHAVQRGDSWNQTIRLAIDPSDVAGCHVVMSIAEGYGFPFALCWMPLWDHDAFVQDGDHALSLYKYDAITSAVRSGRGAYLSLPWKASTRDEAVTGPLASTLVRTYLCSTSFSQNPNLLGLLRWNERSDEEVLRLLKQFPFVPEMETVKLLKDVFNALFGIVVHYSGKDDFEDLVFSALVTVLGIVNDRRFNLEPIVDEYAKDDFSYPFAFPCLLRSMTRLLDDPTSSEHSRQLRSTLKVGAYILKFMIKARQQQVKKEVDIGINSHRPTFAKDLHAIFSGIEALVKDKNPVLVGTKTLVVQNYHTYLPELKGVMNSEEILTIASGFIGALHDVEGKLIIYKLLLIQHISHAELFPGEETRKEWISNVAEWISPHWGKQEGYTSQWRDQTRVCCSILATFFRKYNAAKSTSLWARKLHQSHSILRLLLSSKAATKTFSPLFPSSYPFPTKQVDTEAHFDEALLEITALLAETTDTPPEKYPDLPMDELSLGIQALLNVVKSILDFEAFPPDWISLHIYHHRSSLVFMNQLYHVLVAKYLPQPDDAESFNVELWQSYLLILLKIVTTKAVHYESFGEQRRRAVWKIGGDIRKTGAELLSKSWRSLGWEPTLDEQEKYNVNQIGGYQVPFVPGLVGPIAELCLSPHGGLRHVAAEIMRSMIIGEWLLNHSLEAIQAELIDCLERLFRTDSFNPDEERHKIFIDNIRVAFEDRNTSGDKPLSHAVTVLLDTISHLLDLLVAAYQQETSSETVQIYETIRLLEYFKVLGKMDTFKSYVHRLSERQAKNNLITEAGLALKLHAGIYDWDTSTLLQPTVDPDFPAQTAFERKEQIYLKILQHFESAQAWHQALVIYFELSDQYMTKVFDYSKLARAQHAIATIYEKISKGEYQARRFFRVVFRGKGFHSLCDKQFVFDAAVDERTSTFRDRLQQQYPNASIVGSDRAEVIEGQFISIFNIAPQRDFTKPVNQRPNVTFGVRDYLMTASTQRFSHTTRKASYSHSILDQRQDKVVCTTRESFPNVLGRSEITKREPMTFGPVQVGIERALRKTEELRRHIHQAHEGGEAHMTALTELLMILASPKSVGGVWPYWELLQSAIKGPNGHTEESHASNTSSLAQELDPLQLALRTALIDHYLAIRTALDLYTRSAHQATRLDLEKEITGTFAPVIQFYNTVNPAANHPTSSQLPIPTATAIARDASPAGASSPKPNGIPHVPHTVPVLSQTPSNSESQTRGGIASSPVPALNFPDPPNTAHSEDSKIDAEGTAKKGGLLKRLSRLDVSSR